MKRAKNNKPQNSANLSNLSTEQLGAEICSLRERKIKLVLKNKMEKQPDSSYQTALESKQQQKRERIVINHLCVPTI